MNKERRKLIALANMKIEEARELLEACRDDEQEYYDNMPESIQNGDKASAVMDAIGTLDDAVNSLEGIDLSEFEGPAK